MQPAREWAKRMQKLQVAHRALPLWQPDSMADLLVILWQLRVRMLQSVSHGRYCTLKPLYCSVRQACHHVAFVQI